MSERENVDYSNNKTSGRIDSIRTERSDMSDACSVLVSGTEGILGAIKSLEERIGSVLMPKEKLADKTDELQEHGNSDISRFVFKQGELVHLAIRRIHEIIERVNL